MNTAIKILSALCVIVALILAAEVGYYAGVHHEQEICQKKHQHKPVQQRCGTPKWMLEDDDHIPVCVRF